MVSTFAESLVLISRHDKMCCVPILSNPVLRRHFSQDARTVDVRRQTELQPAKSDRERRRSERLRLVQVGRPKVVPISGLRVLQDSDLYVNGGCKEFGSH